MTNHRPRPCHSAALILLLFTGLLAACQAPPAADAVPRETGSPPAGATTAPEAGLPTVTVPARQLSVLGYTHIRPDGNRVAAGRGALPDAPALDIQLAGTPKWVTAVPLNNGTLWGVVLDTDFTQAFFVEGDTVTPVAIEPRVLVDTAPLLLVNDLGENHFALPPIVDPGGSHPVRLNSQNFQAYTNAAGELFAVDNRMRPLGDFSELRALSDGRLMVDENGRFLVLTDPTERYDHGVLGDALEAGGMALITPDPAGTAPGITHITIPEPQVIEGLAPIWTDWDGDEQREIIVTLADATQGAQLALFSEAGELTASGPAIGQGYRWRHPIAVAPFGPDDELELAVVATPHLGGIVEFYRWEGNALNIVATLPGFTSHVLGSRNLDMGAAGDFDGDGRIELLLPTQERTQLGGLYRTPDGVDVAWTVPLDGQLTTNIGAVTRPNGDLLVGAGTDSEVLRIWAPDAGP